MRYLSETLATLTESKVVLLSGARQVGKTTLAEIWRAERDGLYLNWDIPEHRERILRKDFITSLHTPCLVLDEVHKYARWKSLVKGLFDATRGTLPTVVTGSARLDVFQRGGDSLLGRYELLRLHPFSVGEVISPLVKPPPATWLSVQPAPGAHDTWLRLERRSGFPEPFTRDNSLQHRRWSTRRRDLLVREDLRELSQIRALALVEQLVLLLPERVGSPLSINALREDLQVAHDTVKQWLDVLERLYVAFRISPYSARMTRAVRKEQKLYLWDYSAIDDDGARFENAVASHLLKSVHTWTDLGYGEYDLRYFRDRDGNEVDFVLTDRRRPVALFECKLRDTAPSASLVRLGEKLGIPCVQLVRDPVKPVTRGTLTVATAADYFAGWS